VSEVQQPGNPRSTAGTSAVLQGVLARGLWVAIVILSLVEGAMIVATLRASALDQWDTGLSLASGPE